MTKVNLKICLLAIYMFVGFLKIALLVYGFTYFFLQEILSFSYWSLMTFCILRILIMLCYPGYRYFFSACCGPFGLIYSLQTLAWYQVERELLLTSFFLPEKSSVLSNLAAPPHHKPPSCFRSMFRRDFPSVL